MSFGQQVVTGAFSQVRAPRTATVLVASAAVWGIANLFVVRDGGSFEQAFDVCSVVICLAIPFVLWAGVRHERRDRKTWWMVLIALVTTQVSAAAWLTVFDRATVAPSDIGHVMFFVLLFVATIRLAQSRSGMRSPAQLLDGAVVGFGLAAAIVAIAYPPLIARSPQTSFAVGLNLGYSIAGLILMAVLLAGLGAVAWRGDGEILWLLASLMVIAVGDILNLLSIAGRSDHDVAVSNSFWLLGGTFAAMAPWSRHRPGSPKAAAKSRIGRLTVPSVVALAAIALLVVASQWRMPLVAVLLAALALGGSRLRAAVAFRELRELAGVRTEARTDELTELGNRRSFVESLDTALASASDERPVAVVLIDLDDFKEVNDTLGHHFGDELLMGVGRILRENVRSQDVVARLGGDEFALVMPDVDAHAAFLAGESLRHALCAPLAVGSMSVVVDASVGISVAPVHAVDASTLLRFADIAMYAAKRHRSGTAIYTSALDMSGPDRFELTQDIREAVTDGQIMLHYQPKVEIATGRVVGTEALARWEHPTRGLLQPTDFLPLVEQVGIVHDLTRHVLDVAVRQLAEWAVRGLDWTVAVNIAPADLMNDALPLYVADLLHSLGVEPQRLVLEVTEGALVTDPARAARTIGRLRHIGVLISLDDFGVGFSSLVHLRTMEFDELKLDRTLADGLEFDQRGRAIVRAAVELAATLDLQLVAEGVETETARTALAQLGVRFAQGWLFSRAQPAPELERWATEQRPASSAR
jgi:diguanylate cyclase